MNISGYLAILLIFGVYGQSSTQTSSLDTLRQEFMKAFDFGSIFGNGTNFSIMEIISSMAVKSFEDPSTLDSRFTMIENGVFRIFNVSTERQKVMREVGDMFRDSLLKHYAAAKNSSDWSKLSSNAQLRKVIMDTMMDPDFSMRRQLVNSTAVAEMLEQNQWIVNGSETLEKKNKTLLTKLYGAGNAELILNVYNKTVYETKMGEMAGDWNQLRPVQKFMFTVAAINYTAMTEVKFTEFIANLENKTDVSADIKQTFEKLGEMLQQVMYVINPQTAVNMSNLNADVFLTELSELVNRQLGDMYDRFGRGNSSFQKENSFQQVFMLLSEFDYGNAGMELTLPILRQIDDMLPSTVKITLEVVVLALRNRKTTGGIDQIIRAIPGMNDQELVAKTVDILILISDNMNRTVLDGIPEYKNSTTGPVVKLGYIMTSLPGDTLKEIGGRIGDILFKVLPNVISQGISGQIQGDWLVALNNLKDAADRGDEEFYAAMYMIFNTTIPQNFITTRVITHPVFTGSLRIASDHVHQVYTNLTRDVPGFRQMNVVMQAMTILTNMDWVAMMNDITTHSGGEIGKIQEYFSDIMSPSINDQCGRDLALFRSSLSFKNFGNPSENWAWKMVDAFGKPGSDMLEGGLTWAGSKVECDNIRGHRLMPDNSTKKWALGTNYCISKWAMPPSIFPAQPGGGRSSFSIGVCLPDSCHKQDLVAITKFTELLSINSSSAYCFDELPANTGAGAHDHQYILAWCIIGFFITLTVACSTIDRVHYIRLENSRLNSKNKKDEEKKIELKYLSQNGESEPNVYSNDGYENEHELPEIKGNGVAEKPEMNGNGFSHEKSGMNGNGVKHVENGTTHNDAEKSEKPKKEMSVFKGIVKAFSVFNNMSFLLNTTERPGSLKGLNGIRFLSMSWVIIGHVYALPMSFQPMAIKSPMGVFRWAQDWQFQAIMAGIFSVDSFFLLSGLLVGYLFLKMMDKINGKLKCMHMVLYYVHRYLRLTPLLAAVILIVVGFSKYLGSGPFMQWEQNYNHLFCEKRWWSALLYVNNFAYSSEPCIGWIWYLANDMQFYMISPLILIPLYKKRVIGFIIIGVLMAFHWGITIYLWYSLDSHKAQMTGNPQSFDKIYIKPYTRIGPYLVGIILAYILFKKYRITNKIVHAVLWLLCIGMIAFLVYIPWDDIKDLPNIFMDGHWTILQRALYEGFSRTAWAVALSWIIYACNNNAAGVVGDILNWSGWAPLSKLTYSAFLVHPILQLIDLYNINQPIYMDHYDQIKQFIVVLVSSYSGGAVLHLLFEAPMAGIEKLILPKSK